MLAPAAEAPNPPPHLSARNPLPPPGAAQTPPLSGETGCSPKTPIVVILISLYTFYMRWNLLNTYRGLILIDTAFALPLAINLMKSFFDTLPKSLDESATIDGAGRLRTLWSILMPLVLPGLLAVGIYTFLNAWDDFLMALTIMQDTNMKTLTVGLAQSFLGEYAYDYGALMAFSLCGSLPVVLIFVFLQRYMISGLTAGAVKG